VVPGAEQAETGAADLQKHECSSQTDRLLCRFDKAVTSLVGTELGEDFTKMVDGVEAYFVDFLRDPPEPTGDEPDDFDFSAPKIYDPIPSFDFLEEKLQR